MAESSFVASATFIRSKRTIPTPFWRDWTINVFDLRLEDPTRLDTHRENAWSEYQAYTALRMQKADAVRLSFATLISKTVAGEPVVRPKK
jgi:hypothetical protein